MTTRTTLAILAVAALTSCAGAPRPAGHLVVIGGGLSREHGDVYRRILELAGENATVGVLPTASGVPEESGEGWTEAFDAWASRPVTEVVPLTTSSPELAADPDVATAIRSHGALFFTGGDQSRIVSVLRPAEGDTECYRAVLDVLRAGGTVAGSSAGAAMMSDPMIRGGRSASAIAEGASAAADEPDRGVWIGNGMGLFPYGIVDQHFLARGRLGRLIVAVHEADQRFGFGVEEDSALVVDLGSHRIETIGPKALVLVDDVIRDGPNWTALVSLLGNGDLVDGRTGAVRPAPHKRRLWPATENGTLELGVGPWEDGAITDAIASLGRGEASRVRLADARSELILASTPATAFFADPRTRPATITAIALTLEARPLGGADR